jgi:hypothetical protein
VITEDQNIKAMITHEREMSMLMNCKCVMPFLNTFGVTISREPRVEQKKIAKASYVA